MSLAVLRRRTGIQLPLLQSESKDAYTYLKKQSARNLAYDLALGPVAPNLLDNVISRDDVIVT